MASGLIAVQRVKSHKVMIGTAKILRSHGLIEEARFLEGRLIEPHMYNYLLVLCKYDIVCNNTTVIQL